MLILSIKTSFGALESNNKLIKKEIDWAEHLAEQEREIFFQNISDQSFIENTPDLKIFVSSSMPTGLLKEYGKEASIYGGTLVFNGLPDGSMIKFLNLIQDIFDPEDMPRVQIDDESFKLFKIEQVPSIVLARTENLKELMEDKSGTIPKYDKIVGNVGIKYALKRFSEDGEMAVEAYTILNSAKVLSKENVVN